MILNLTSKTLEDLEIHSLFNPVIKPRLISEFLLTPHSRCVEREEEHLRSFYISEWRSYINLRSKFVGIVYYHR
jgi:hypothetical protein